MKSAEIKLARKAIFPQGMGHSVRAWSPAAAGRAHVAQSPSQGHTGDGEGQFWLFLSPEANQDVGRLC